MPGEDLIPIGYIDSNFYLDLDFRKSTSSCVFTLWGGVISWRSIKQSSIVDFTMEAKYVAACEAAKEAIWLKKFLSNLGVMRMKQVPMTLFYDNSGAVTQSKDPRNHKKWKHIERKYHIIQDIMARGDMIVAKIDGANNLAYPFMKALPRRAFKSHLEGMEVRLMRCSLKGKWEIVKISALKSYCTTLCYK